MPTPPPVSTLDSHIGFWLRFVSNHVSSAFRQKVEARGVTIAEWVVLRIVFNVPDARPSQIADQIGMTRGAVSKLVDKLTAKGLIRPRAETSDRRRLTLILTPKGRRLVPILAQLADENDHEYFGHMDAQARAALTTQLQSIARYHRLKNTPID